MNDLASLEFLQRMRLQKKLYRSQMRPVRTITLRIGLVPENYNWFLRINNRRRTTTRAALKRAGYIWVLVPHMRTLATRLLQSHLPPGSYIITYLGVWFADPQHALWFGMVDLEDPRA